MGTYIVLGSDIGKGDYSFAFSSPCDYDTDPLSIHLATWEDVQRVIPISTSVLFTENKVVHSVGYNAEKRYWTLQDDKDHKDWYFFRSFMSSLTTQEGPLLKSATLKAIDGKEILATDFFSAIFKHRRDHYVEMMMTKTCGLNQKEILAMTQWVIPVPAILNDAAKHLMREAAENVGIVGEHLLLVNEEEAAILYAKYHSIQSSEGGVQGISVFSIGSTNIVLNCKEEEVVLLVYKVQQDFSLKELYRVADKLGGGNRVDEAFLQILTKIVGTSAMNTFRYTNASDYFAMNQSFVNKKRSFTYEAGRNVFITMPQSLKWEFEKETGEDIKKAFNDSMYSAEIQWITDKICLTAGLMKSLFRDPCSKITALVSDVLQKTEIKGTINIVMLGAFSECLFLRDMIKQTFPDIRVVVPPEITNSGLVGAVIYGHEHQNKPKNVPSRVAKFILNFKNGPVVRV